MKVEIKGVEFSNKGAELMLHSVIAALDAHLGDYELVLTPGHLLPYPQRARLGAWQKFSFVKAGVDWTSLGNHLPGAVLRLLRHFGIVAEKEIDLVLDASGFVYSDDWDAPILAKTARHMARLEGGKTRYVFLPQAFGPFEQGNNKALMKRLIDSATLVIARDEQSFRSLREIGDSPKVMQYPDFTPLLDVSELPLPNEAPAPGTYACIIPNSKMIRGKGEAQTRQYLSFLQQAVSVVQTLGLTPVLLNHEGEKDSRLCGELMAQMTLKPLLLDGLDVFAVKNVIGKAAINLSSRFHGCVSGLSQGVPTLATSWSHKYEQLYRYYDCPEQVLSTDVEVGVLEQKLSALFDEREQHSEKLLQRAEQHKAEVAQMWQTVFKGLE